MSTEWNVFLHGVGSFCILERHLYKSLKISIFITAIFSPQNDIFHRNSPPRNQKEIKPRKLAVVVLDDPIIMRLWTKRCSDSYVYSSWNNKPLSKRTCQWLALKVHVVFKYNSGSSPNLMLLYLLKALPYSCQNNWLSFKTIFCRCI